jgi:hypothetical protein
VVTEFPNCTKFDLAHSQHTGFNILYLEKWKSCDEVTGKTGKEEKSQTLAFS